MAVEDWHRSAIDLARQQVPRYLFRVYSESSGNHHHQKDNTQRLNDKTKITPHAFLDIKNLPPVFHQISPGIIAQNALAHYRGRKNWSSLPYKSLFSSWTPSLLLALCYARAKHDFGEQGICICIIDTGALNHEIANADTLLHWDSLVQDDIANQRKTLEERATNLEYMVFGNICNTQALRVVEYRDILSTNLTRMLPDWTRNTPHRDWLGRETRERWFGKDPKLFPKQPGGLPVSQPEVGEVETAMAVGRLYGSAYALPVATALLSLRPRPWGNGKACQDWGSAVSMIQHSKGLKRLLKLAANCSPLPVNLRSDGISFECRPDNKDYSPEVKQHHFLLKIIWRALYPTMNAPGPKREPNSAGLRDQMCADDRWQNSHFLTGAYEVATSPHPLKRNAAEEPSLDEHHSKRVKRED